MMSWGSQGDRTTWRQVVPWPSWAVTLENSHWPSEVAFWVPMGIIRAVDFCSVCVLPWELFGRRMLRAHDTAQRMVPL